MAGEAETTAPEDIEENDDDFNAGFAPEAPQPTETPAAADEATQQPEATAEASPPPPPEPKYVQITEDDWQALQQRAAKVDEISATFGKRLDQAFGKVGGIERVISEMQTKTPEGEAVQVTDEDFADLKNEYPELAALHISGLNKVLSKLKGTGGANPEAIEKIVTERVTAATAAIRTELVNATLDAVVDGEWLKEVNSPAFDDWIKTQPNDVKALAESDSLNDAKRMLRLYKQAKDTPPAPLPPVPKNTTRARQIAAAVTPKGDGGHPPGPTEDDEFNAGFKSG